MILASFCLTQRTFMLHRYHSDSFLWVEFLLNVEDTLDAA